INAKL
ncbi:MAG: hypothetical protein EZS28_055413, partial [Streblomastix strix]